MDLIGEGDAKLPSDPEYPSNITIYPPNHHNYSGQYSFYRGTTGQTWQNGFGNTRASYDDGASFPDRPTVGSFSAGAGGTLSEAGAQVWLTFLVSDAPNTSPRTNIDVEVEYSLTAMYTLIHAFVYQGSETNLLVEIFIQDVESGEKKASKVVKEKNRSSIPTQPTTSSSSGTEEMHFSPTPGHHYRVGIHAMTSTMAFGLAVANARLDGSKDSEKPEMSKITVDWD